MVAWDDPEIDWAMFDAVVIRSTWDSVDRPHDYLRWTREVASATHLINSPATVEWGLDKRYLVDLEQMGVPVVPTVWVQPGMAWESSPREFVVKPAISAGSRNTVRYSPNDVGQARAHVDQLHAVGQTVMVQDYYPTVENSGELNIVFIDGVRLHAVRKGPMLELGAGVVERPWERITWWGLSDPNEMEISVAEHTMARVFEHLGEKVVYGRVDLILDPAGQPLVNEVELVDPVLSLTLAPNAATKLAGAVARRLSS